MAKKDKSIPTTGAPVSASEVKQSMAQEMKWRAQDALRTCEEYKKIEKDKPLMKEVKKLAKAKIKDLQKVTK